MDEKIFAYALRLLSSRDYPEKLLQEKLEKKFSFEKKDEIFLVISHLKDKKYVDDSRTAENFVRYKKEYTPKGKILLRQEMVQKKFSTEIIEQALEENFSEKDEKKCAELLAEKKISRLANEEDSQKKKEKFFRFMASKGFSFSLINDVWNDKSMNA